MKKYILVPRMHPEVNTILRESHEEFLSTITSFNPFENAHQDFPLNASESRMFYEHMKGLIAESAKNPKQYDEFSEQKNLLVSAKASGGSGVLAKIESQSSQSLSSDEEEALQGFALGLDLDEKTSHTDTDERTDRSDKNLALSLQKTLILAVIQEEQDLELHRITNLIAAKEHTVDGLLKNPQENMLQEVDIMQEEHFDSLEKEQVNMQKSIAFTPLKNASSPNIFPESLKKQAVKSIDTHKGVPHSQGIIYSTGWQKIFFPELYFLGNENIFVVNDVQMQDDLLSLAKAQPEDTVYCADIQQLPSSEWAQWQEFAKKKEQTFSLLTVATHVLFNEYGFSNENNIEGDCIFLLSQDL